MAEQTLTDEFVEAFETEEACAGVMARIMAKSGMLPLGVDPDDPRVVAVMERCRRVHGVSAAGAEEE